MNRSEYMKGNQRAKKEKDRRYDWDTKEKRTRYCDFHRVEDNRNESNLGNFELEVKERIACVPSPYEYLARAEEEAEMASEEDVISAKLGHLVRKARLTHRQYECYKKVYVRRMDEASVAKQMGISQSALCQLKNHVEAKIIRVHQELNKKSTAPPQYLTPRQKKIYKMRYSERLTFREIARRLGIRVASAHRMFARMQKNISRRKRVTKR